MTNIFPKEQLTVFIPPSVYTGPRIEIPYKKEKPGIFSILLALFVAGLFVWSYIGSLALIFRCLF